MSTTPLYPANKQPLGVRFRRAMTRWWPLYLMLLPGIIYFLVYKYAPMYGLVIAFKKFSIKKGILGSPWVTPWYKYFEQFFSSPANRNVIKNTITLSLWKLAVGLFPSLIFALAVSECRNRFFARIVQTISYLPHFLSWVIIYGICATMLGETSGVINNLFKKLGWNTVPFLNSSKYIRGVLVGSSLWQSIGWSSIVYLAAIAGIDTSMYEAATIDGCGRFRQIWYITLPNLGRIFVVLLITKVGNILDGGFNQVYVFMNDRVRASAEIIDTWVYTQGLGKAQYSLTTAVGLMKSVLSCGLVLGTNALARKWDSSLW